MQRVWGIAGMNGSYFVPNEKAYSQFGEGNATNSERIYKGDAESYSRFWPDTGPRGIFWFDDTNKFLFVQNNMSDGGNYKRNVNSNRLWELYYGISNFPVLLEAGEDVTNYFRDEIHVDNKLISTGTKSFICATQDEQTIIMGFIGPVNIYTIPQTLKDFFGCRWAVNLDGGGSAAMINDEDYVVGPGRNLMDSWIIVPDEGLETYQKRKSEERELAISTSALTPRQQEVLSAMQSVIPRIISNKSDWRKQRQIKQLQAMESNRKMKDNYTFRKLLREIVKVIK